MIKLEVIYRADEFISHGDEENLSTITPFRRQKIVYDGQIIEIPVITGNSVRGKLRRIAAQRLLELLGIEKISSRLYHILFSGGILDQSESVIDIGFVKKVRRLLPVLSLFGAALGNTILSGKISIGFVYPIGKETALFTGIDSEHSVFEYLETVFYTRREDYEEDEEALEKNDTSQMKYEIEVLVPGTKFKQLIVLNTNDVIEQSAFMDTWQMFTKDPRLGGQSRVGHGRVEIENINGIEKLPNPEKYVSYIKEHNNEIKEFLESLE